MGKSKRKKHRGNICPYCSKGMGTDRSRDHINPRVLGGTLPIPNVINIRICHAVCNTMKQMAGECPGTLACAMAVAQLDLKRQPELKRFNRQVRKVLSKWGLMHKENSNVVTTD